LLRFLAALHHPIETLCQKLFPRPLVDYNTRHYLEVAIMSDGRFSSKPIRSERACDIAWSAGDFTADARPLSATARAFVQSAAIRREVNALMDCPFPQLSAVTCAPLHKDTPAGATELGRPLTSAALVQEYLIGLIFLRVAGWIFMLFGALILLAAVVTPPSKLTSVATI